MKKFLAVLGCLIGFAGIVVLCYFYGYGSSEIIMPEGKYYLQKIRESFDEKEYVEFPIENSDLYLEVYEDNKLESFSTYLQGGIVYDCQIYGTGLGIYDGEEEKSGGYFVESLIIIKAKETREVDGEEKDIFIEYYYELQ